MSATPSKFRHLLRAVIIPVLRRVAQALPAGDAWEKLEARVSLKSFGCGCLHEWAWYFEGQSTVQVKSIEDVCDWLSGCEYKTDKALFNEPDFWQHPITFERTRQGDCEDHSLWAWRKLSEFGYEAELIRGHCFDGRDLSATAHAAVVFKQNGASYFMEATAKRGREQMLLPITAAHKRFCPDFSVDSSFKTYRYGGQILTLRRRLRE